LGNIKNLAGQTAIYGVSSILGRLLNYLLVPLYSRVFLPDEAAVYVEMYAYVAFLIVLLTYGMETAFFRFNEKNGKNSPVFSTILTGILFSSVIFVTAAICLSGPISDLLRYPNNPEYIIYFALIIGLDAFTSIPFAKLRAENRSVRFATIKLINIGVNIGLNLFLLLFVPYAYNNLSWGPDAFGMINSGEPIIGHIFVANLAASAIVFLLLTPDFLKIRFRFDRKLWVKMFRYAFPLLILGLAGVANEMVVDRVLIKYLLPENIAAYQLGIYGMVFKIAIAMTIFTQAFRYAAEPFFFAIEKEKNSKIVYADVMKYFIILMTFMFLSIMLYMDIVKYFLGKEYYSGLKIVPILLYSHIFLGIFYNLSIWYKLSGQTRFGAYISILGTIISITLNIILIPRIGYVGSAWANFVCYAVMMVVSYFLGQKYYHVQYDMLKIFIYMGLSAALWYISVLFAKYVLPDQPNMQMAFNTLLLFIFIVVIFSSEPRLMLRLKSIGKNKGEE